MEKMDIEQELSEFLFNETNTNWLFEQLTDKGIKLSIGGKEDTFRFDNQHRQLAIELCAQFEEIVTARGNYCYETARITSDLLLKALAQLVTGIHREHGGQSFSEALDQIFTAKLHRDSGKHSDMMVGIYCLRELCPSAVDELIVYDANKHDDPENPQEDLRDYVKRHPTAKDIAMKAGNGKARYLSDELSNFCRLRKIHELFEENGDELVRAFSLSDDIDAHHQKAIQLIKPVFHKFDLSDPSHFRQIDSLNDFSRAVMFINAILHTTPSSIMEPNVDSDTFVEDVYKNIVSNAALRAELEEKVPNTMVEYVQTVSNEVEAYEAVYPSIN